MSVFLRNLAALAICAAVGLYAVSVMQAWQDRQDRAAEAAYMRMRLACIKPESQPLKDWCLEQLR